MGHRAEERPCPLRYLRGLSNARTRFRLLLFFPIHSDLMAVGGEPEILNTVLRPKKASASQLNLIHKTHWQP
jgi:hypothetical protein